jgi:hypothetical protein
MDDPETYRPYLLPPGAAILTPATSTKDRNPSSSRLELYADNTRLGKNLRPGRSLPPGCPWDQLDSGANLA